jgi:hypothetical protein
MNETSETADVGAVAFDNLNRQAQKAGEAIATALANGQSEGRKLDDVLRGVGARLGTIALRTAGTSLTSSLSSTLSQTLAGSIATTGVQTTSLATPFSFANFGTDFAQRPAAIAPQSSNAQAIRPMNITLNVSTPDANSFRNSEAQVTAALTRAVQRGQRSL